MIGRMIGMFIGRKAKAKVVDAVLDKVNLPDPIEGAIRIAATGNVGDLLGGMGKDMAREVVLDTVTKKVSIKRPKK
jgi:uncharacterized protein with ATP-grasp and redox domains